MKDTRIEKMRRFYAQKGIDYAKHIKWLCSEGIAEQVAYEVSSAVYVELKHDSKRHMDPDSYPETMRKLFRKDLPEDFWIDRYTLERCKKIQSKIFDTQAAKNTAVQVATIDGEVKDLSGEVSSLSGVIDDIANERDDHMSDTLYWIGEGSLEHIGQIVKLIKVSMAYTIGASALLIIWLILWMQKVL